MIDCPVCDKKNVTSTKCPQCETDLNPLIRLAGIPSACYREGMDLLQKGQLDEAIERFLMALWFDAGNGSIHVALAEAYASKNLYAESLKYLQRALTIDPGNQEIKSTIQRIEKVRAYSALALEKEKRNVKLMRKLLLGVPVLTFIVGLAIVPLIERSAGLRAKTRAGVVSSVEEIRKRISRYPDLSLVVNVTPRENGITLSGIVPTASHKDLVVEISNNVAGSEFVETHDLVVSPARTPEFIYTVKPGENLSLIAHKFYGDGRKWLKLYQANRSKMARPDQLSAGVIISVPNM